MTVSDEVLEPAISRAMPRAHGAARHYAAFGGVLASAIDFPELLPVTAVARPDWRFDVASGNAPALPLELVGERRIGPEWYRLQRAAHGFRLEYSHAGVFDITADGSAIVWYERDDALLERVRSIVLGPALALALELAGFLCLHGSAVTVGDEAIAFVGPKYHGKSTLATALVGAGARLVADDLLAVLPGPAASIVRPGVASVRLWEDAARALPLSRICNERVSGVKVTATGFARDHVVHDESRLAAVYVLAPVRSLPDGEGLARAPLRGAAAAVTLAQQCKLADELIGLAAAGRRLATAAAVARTAPVSMLRVVRDFARLDALADQIIAWHAGAPHGPLPLISTEVQKL